MHITHLQTLLGNYSMRSNGLANLQPTQRLEDARATQTTKNISHVCLMPLGEVMESAQQGFIKSLMGLFSGFVISIMVSSVLTIRFARVILNVGFILVGIVSLERTKYRGRWYALGCFSGLVLFRNYFLVTSGWIIYVLVVGGYVLQKSIR